MLKRGEISTKLFVYILFLIIIGLTSTTAQLGQLGVPGEDGNVPLALRPKCSDLSPAECLKYDNCQLVESRKQRERCVEKPQPTVCKIGGCSGELCGEASFIASVVSPCLYKEEYACYKEFGRCERQTTGKCGWTQTEELVNCIRRYQKPVCGNNICEEGEKQCLLKMCPQCAAGSPPENCQCKEICTYSCPQDCKKPVCGNGVCEKGEDEIIGQTNSIPPSYIIKCPQDCQRPLSTCTDSDGGVNYYVKGFVSKGAERFTDQCAGTIDPVTLQIGGPFVQEWYCATDGSIQSDRYLCPNGCKDGVCLLQESKCGNSICEDEEIGICLQDCCPQLSPPLKKEGCTYTPKHNDDRCVIGYEEKCETKPICNSLTPNECTRYEHCQVVKGRKQRQKCVER